MASNKDNDKMNQERKKERKKEFAAFLYVSHYGKASHTEQSKLKIIYGVGERECEL